MISSTEHPEIATDLATLLQSYLDNGRSTPGDPQPPDKPISLDEIRYHKKTKEGKESKDGKKKAKTARKESRKKKD